MDELQVGRENFGDLQRLLSAEAGQLLPMVTVHSRIKGDAQSGWRRALLAEDVAAKFRDEAVECALGDDVLDQIELYTFDNMVEGQIGFWSGEESDDVLEFITDIVNSEDAGVLDIRDRDYVNSLDMFTVNINIQGETVYFVTRSLSSTLVKRKGINLSFDADRNRLIEVSSDVFNFVIQPSVIVWRGAVYILNRQRFELMTGLRAATIEKSMQAFRYIVEDLRIEIPASEELIDVINKKPLLYRRLASASAKGVLSRLSSVRMVERIRALGLPITYEERNGDYEFNVDHEDNVQVKEIVYLMTDYYLHSPVTDLEHRAPSTHVNIR